MNQYGMMNMNQMNMNQMDYALQHLPPHILQHVNATAIGARPPQKEPRERKDKNAPKRNWSAYQFYVEEVASYVCLPSFRAQHSGTTHVVKSYFILNSHCTECMH